MQKNKITTYLLYAIGEIVLVVIGILIAVSLNNWNNQRKADEKADWLLRQIQKEALGSVRMIEVVHSTYTKHDSIYQILQSDTLVPSDYIKNAELRRYSYSYVPFSIQREAFDTYIAQVDDFSPKYQAISSKLKFIYVAYDDWTRDHMSDPSSLVASQYAYAESQEWYSSLFASRADDVDPSFINYLMNSSHFKNKATSFNWRMKQKVQVLFGLQQKLVDIYFEINELLEQPTELPEIIKNYYLELPSNEKRILLGVYKNEWGDQLTITSQDGNYSLNGETSYLVHANQLFTKYRNPIYRTRYVFDLEHEIVCLKTLFTQECYTKK